MSKPINKNSKRVLCACRGGISRSNVLMSVLKYQYGNDVLNCGVEGNEPETLEMLYNWAEVIVVLRDFFKDSIPEKYHHKVRILDVGVDRFWTYNEELMQICMEWASTQPDLTSGVERYDSDN